MIIGKNPLLLHNLHFITLVTAALFLLAHPAHCQSLRDLLNHRIIDEGLPLTEVQDYTERRVPILLPPRSLDDWEDQAAQIRRDVLANVIFRGEAAKWRQAPAQVEWLDSLDGGPGYRIRKLRYEALPGWWIPALLYLPDQLKGKVPVVLNVNGHEDIGKAADYKQIRCINQAKRGMIALNPEWIGMGQLRGTNYQHYRMNQLNLCGASGLAPFYLALERGLDLLLSLENADPERVAVAGLSGGGWQTIFISSIDTRVTLANPVAGYSSFRTRVRHQEDLGDSEQTPSDLARYADYTHLTAMLAPRAALLTFNAADNCCFASPHALDPLLVAATPVYRLYGETDRLRAHINFNPGTHNFGADNRIALYRMLGNFFDPEGSTTELEMTAELKTAAELDVPIPDDNAHFNSLALRLSQDLPRSPAPASVAGRSAWQHLKRAELRERIRLRNPHVRAQLASTTTAGNLTAHFWKFKIDDEWTVPVVELSPAQPKGTALLITDTGRQAAAAHAERLVAAGWRVVAVDLFYFGESRIRGKDFLYALLVDSVGERNIGIQTGQLIGIAGWFKERFPSSPLRIVAIGPRNGTVALLTHALDSGDLDHLELHNPLDSFKRIITESWPVTKAPELFCFGLLETADIEQLKLLGTAEISIAE